MKLIRQVSELERWRKTNGARSIGFVPTMGALHDGHLSLVRAARKENDRVVVSIFVNPAQFGPNEDFRSYPRNPARDRKLLKQEGVDVLFHPGSGEMYPEGFQTEVKVDGIARGLCGKFRPVHFAGVATIVTKLFNLVRPSRAYFGAKDYQQALVVRRMAEDLHFPVQIRVLPTVRESDGLAMSSRNAHLKRLERIQAPMVNLALEYAEGLINQGVRSPGEIRREVQSFLRPFVSKIDYVELVHPESLAPLRKIQGNCLLAIACYIGKTRLIDSRVVRVR